MKDIIWQGDEREIPGVGIATKGSKLKVPEHMAKSFVHQGLANYLKTKEESK